MTKIVLKGYVIFFSSVLNIENQIRATFAVPQITDELVSTTFTTPLTAKNLAKAKNFAGTCSNNIPYVILKAGGIFLHHQL